MVHGGQFERSPHGEKSPQIQLPCRFPDYNDYEHLAGWAEKRQLQTQALEKHQPVSFKPSNWARQGNNG
jgi:hypothetical protein